MLKKLSSIPFNGTAEQEAELDEAIETLKSELALDGKTDYEKVKAIYDYMTANISYDYEHYGDDKIVDVNIRRIRMKIEDEPSIPKHLVTVWGMGYKWC